MRLPNCIARFTNVEHSCAKSAAVRIAERHEQRALIASLTVTPIILATSRSILLSPEPSGREKSHLHSIGRSSR